MTADYVLDTDHISLLQRGDKKVLERFGDVQEDSVASSIVSYEEQLRGRLSIVRRARTPDEPERQTSSSSPTNV